MGEPRRRHSNSGPPRNRFREQSARNREFRDEWDRITEDYIPRDRVRSDSNHRRHTSRDEYRGRSRGRGGYRNRDSDGLRFTHDDSREDSHYDAEDSRSGSRYDTGSRRRSDSSRYRPRYNRRHFDEDLDLESNRAETARRRVCLCSDGGQHERRGRSYSSPRVTTPEDYDPFYAGSFEGLSYRPRRFYDDQDFDDAESIFNPPAGVPYSLVRAEPYSYRVPVTSGRIRSKTLYNRRYGRGFGLPRVTTPEEYDPFYADGYVDVDLDDYDSRPLVYNPPAGVPYSLFRREPISFRKAVLSSRRRVKNFGRKGRGYNFPRVSTPETYDPYYAGGNVDLLRDVDFDGRQFVYNPPAGVPYSLYRDEPKAAFIKVVSSRRRHYGPAREEEI